ncbi:MAG: hypothetical protein HFJ25_03760 [Clostridia bacterium]|jgi:hypothetical protein|nr:hypothetical protein [Clostridia bacterium]
MKVYVSTGTISGISKRPYYIEEKTVGLIDITFCNPIANDWLWRKAGDTPEESDEWYYNVLLPDFRMAKIYDGTEVTLLINERRKVLAICSANRRNVGWWIDGRDLKAKKFSELGIEISQIVIG